jgi:hypothetical protein
MTTLRNEGFRFFKVLDKDGKLLDVRFLFTTTDGRNEALYYFDNAKMRPSQQRAANFAITSQTLRVMLVGEEPGKRASNNIKPAFNGLASKNVGSVHVYLAQLTKTQFSVRVGFYDAKNNWLYSIDVPFSGYLDDDLYKQAFFGMVELWAADPHGIENMEKTVLDQTKLYVPGPFYLPRYFDLQTLKK